MGDMDDHSDNGLGQFFSADGPGEVDDFCGRAGWLNIDRNCGLASNTSSPRQ